MQNMSYLKLFYFKISPLHSLIVCFPVAVGKVSEPCCSVQGENEMLLSFTQQGREERLLELALHHPPMALGLPDGLQKSGHSQNVMHEVSGISDPFIPLSLCILSSEGKPVVIHLLWEWLLLPILSWLSWYPELMAASRYAIFCSVVPNCFTWGKSNGLFPDWHLKTYLWFTLPQLIFWKSLSLLTGWYLPYILQVTHSRHILLWGPLGPRLFYAIFLWGPFNSHYIGNVNNPPKDTDISFESFLTTQELQCGGIIQRKKKITCGIWFPVLCLSLQVLSITQQLMIFYHVNKTNRKVCNHS